MFLQWDLNNKNLHEEYVRLCEEDFENYFSGIVQNILSYEKIKILTIAGPSSAGKTTIAKKLSHELGKNGITTKVISMDDFYRSSHEIPLKDDGKPNFEVIEALDVDMLVRCFNEILETGKTYLPHFDFNNGRRKPEFVPYELGEHEIMIMEGIHGLNPAIIKHFPPENYKSIYVTLGEKVFLPDNIIFSKRDIRFLRRLIRDYKYRNASPELTFLLWETVRTAESAFIFPYEVNANIKINSIYKYELSVYKNQALPLLNKITADSVYYEKAKRLIDMLGVIPEIDESLVPETSLIREFIGGSFYYK